MTPFAVIEHFNVVNDILSGLISTLVICEKYPLGFQAVLKTLRDRIVKTIPFPAHAADHFIGF